MPTGRRLREPRLVVASHNPGKVCEIADLLAPYAVQAISVQTLGLAEPDETGTTFIANAELKARAAARAANLPALADDSGLDVAGLDGQPGIHSARWAGPKKDFGAAMARVFAELKARKSRDRRARFVCALALCWPDGHCESFTGTVDGELVWPPRGSMGFGYDPIFQPLGADLTFGEIAPAEKHAISHRAKAFRQLIDDCFTTSERGR